MKRRKRLAGVLRLLFYAGAAAFAASAAYVLWLPDVAPLKRSNPKTTCYVELRRAQAAKRGKKLQIRMQWVPWDRISEHLKHAVFIAEDDMFYQHQGVDWEAVRVAFAKDWEEKRLAYGGSTITQQVARNLYLSPSKNPLRKVKEILVAYKLEKVLGKRRIFELYLNIAEWGKGIFGAEAAAQAYFGKPAADLTVDEAVALAVVLPSPKRWSPAKRGRYVERNMRRVMARMRASGYLPEEEGEPVLPEELSVSSGTLVDETPRTGFGSVSSEASFPAETR
ncbi:MAG: monofunctional biosynthetic peptidoglycan transglycosylase [Elusimicrobia bacterium]|nr:monofunctional biosynthetic peptidoglycan transglycosylase [Elusimicrobiota bacterium]